MKLLQIDNAFIFSSTTALITLVVFIVCFVALEPTVGRAATDTFTVSQVITGEVSFSTPAADVTLSPAIAGLTGGVGNGSTYVVITTNNSTGYNMTITFSSTTAMYRNGGGDDINNYVTAVAGFADFVFDSTKPFGQFGYTVSASSTADVALRFRNNGVSCNDSSGGDVVASCWFNPSTTAITLIDRSTATPSSGATSTIHFRVDVPANPVPAISTGTYTATATLTALTNP